MSLCPYYRHRGLLLLPERAVLQEETRTLFVADVHLGKAASFRRLGSPAPAGTTRENLDRLSALLTKYDAARLVFLGDLFHAKIERTPRVLDAFALWRQCFENTELLLVRGNHDKYDIGLPSRLALKVEAEPYVLLKIECRHSPLTDPLRDGATALCGHMHPFARLTGSARDSLRLPCYLLTGRQIILPAFGEFTGGVTVSARDGQRVVVVKDAVAAL